MLTLQSLTADSSLDCKPSPPAATPPNGDTLPRSGEDAVLHEIAEDLGLRDESKQAALYASHYLLPLFEPPIGMELPVDRKVGELLPADFCRRNAMVPLTADDQTVEVAIANPDALPMADEVKRLCGRQMRPLFARAQVIETAWDLLYGEPATGPSPHRMSGASPETSSADACGPADDWSRLGLDRAGASNCRKALTGNSGLVICSGPRGVDKRPVAQSWARSARRIHRSAVSIWQGHGTDREDPNPAAIIVRDLSDRRAAEYCVHRVLEGQRVFAVLHARDLPAIILRMRAWDRIGDTLCELLSLIIHVDPASSPQIRTIAVDASLRDALVQQPRGKSLEQLFPCTGTPACGP